MQPASTRSANGNGKPAPLASLSSSVAMCLRRWSFPLLLAVLLALQGVGLAYFARGFFLTRFEIPAHSQCTPPDAASRAATIAALVRKQNEAGSESADPSLKQQPLSDADSAGAGDSADCWMPRQYDGVVILVVDALRFDFLLTNTTAVEAQAAEVAVARARGDTAAAASEPPWPPYANGLPIASSLLHSPHSAPHTALYRFEADPPTVTMQRLKGLTTGALPTFIDIKDNFGSTGVEEDNWVWQLTHRGGRRQAKAQKQQHQQTEDQGQDQGQSQGRLLFFGDDTWADLYPPAQHFVEGSKAYPSFDVQDLHTVDRGCKAGLEPVLAEEHARLQVEEDALAVVDGSAPPSPPSPPPPPPPPRRWDVLLAHFLGVDHVGHRFGPSHPAMRSKLAEMDRVIREQVGLIERQRRVNKHIRREKRRRARRMGSSSLSEDELPPLPREQHLLLVVLGDHGMTPGGNHGGQSDEEIYAGLLVYSTRRVAQATTQTTTAAAAAGASNEVARARGDEGRMLEEIRASTLLSHHGSAADPSAPSTFSLPPLSPLSTSFLTVPQVDLVPTLSLLLGLPIPFGSLGTVVLELFWGRPDDDVFDGDEFEGQDSSVPSSSSLSAEEYTGLLMLHRIRAMQPLLRALHLNALQVFQFLQAYATLRSSSVGSGAVGVVDEYFGTAEGGLEGMFAAAERSWEEVQMNEVVVSTAASSSLTDAAQNNLPPPLPSLRLAESLCLASARAHYAFLSRATRAAQSKWTVFDLHGMGQGIVLLGALLILRGMYARNEHLHRRQQQQQVQVQPLRLSPRFVAPSLSLSRLLLLLFPAVSLPLYALGWGLAWVGEAADGKVVQEHSLCVGALLALMAGVGNLEWNARRRRRVLKQMAEEVRETAPPPPPPGCDSIGALAWVRGAPARARGALCAVTFQQVVAVLVVLVYVQGLFSNSFIMAEASVALYCAAIIAGSWLFGGGDGGAAAEPTPSSSSSSSSSSSWTRSNLLRVCCILLCLRCMPYASYGTAPDAGWADEKFQGADVGVMVGCMIALPLLGLLAHRALKGGDNKGERDAHRAAAGVPSLSSSASSSFGSFGAAQLVTFVLYPLAIACIGAFWALVQPATTASTTGNAASNPAAAATTTAAAASSAQFVRLGLPRAVYAITVLGIVLLAVWPLRRKRQQRAETHKHADAETQVDLDGSASSASASTDRTAVVGKDAGDGVARRRREATGAAPNGHVALTEAPPATAAIASTSRPQPPCSPHSFAQSCLALFQLVSLPILLVWGPKSSVVLLCLSVVCMSVASFRRTPPRSPLLISHPQQVQAHAGIDLSAHVFFFLLSCHLFWCTGHACSFSSLQISSAFIGMEGFGYYTSGCLLMINTFGGVVLAGTAALAVQAAREVGLPSSATSAPTLAPAAPPRAPAFVPLLHSFSFLFCARCVLSVLNVTLQRRHLMVWAIFAPKFIFDAVAAVVAELTALALAALCTRWTSA